MKKKRVTLEWRKKKEKGKKKKKEEEEGKKEEPLKSCVGMCEEGRKKKKRKRKERKDESGGRWESRDVGGKVGVRGKRKKMLFIYLFFWCYI